ncbi:Global transcription regulator sge1 [Liparis tanakae]|uniref:Global transcription regulator sge1 n=1 Tax=Liparis tanakae TaxID=230148 RepID=A0A4Z2EIU2_9TELE|nr:Global transcription regulator sge1 [Liparis tanakae]
MAVCLLGLVLCDLQNEITEVAHEDLAHEDLVHEDLVHEDLVHEDLVHEDLVHEDLAHEDLAHEDLVHEDLVHEDLVHEDLAHEDLVHEDQAQEDALQMLTESSTTSTTCDLLLDTVLKELGALAADVRALEEKQAMNVMALQETNQKMETRKPRVYWDMQFLHGNTRWHSTIEKAYR